MSYQTVKELLIDLKDLKHHFELRVNIEHTGDSEPGAGSGTKNAVGENVRPAT